MAQPGCFACDSLSVPWTLPGLHPEEGNWVFPPGGLVPKVIALLLGRSGLVGFPSAPDALPPPPRVVEAFRNYRSVLLVREFRQQPWFRALQTWNGDNLVWTYPVCAVFFFPYRDYRISDPQFFIRDGDVRNRLTSSGEPLSGSSRQSSKLCFLLFIFDGAHPLAGRVPVSVALPRLAF